MFYNRIMSCYHPLLASKLKSYSQSFLTSKRIHILGAAKNYVLDGDLINSDMFLIPCGKCIGCRIDNAREWSVRLCHEAETSSSAYFITLTYDDDHLPGDFSLHKEHIQSFIKNLRNYQYYYYGVKNIRYLVSGEYGSKGRAHFHMILFNAVIDDIKIQTVRNGNFYYSSDKINSIWNNGFCVIADVVPETTNYVARYTLKKLGTNDYKKYDLENPFILMSTRPGIGHDYCVAHADEIYNNMCVKLPNGKTASIPKYYLKVLEKLDYDIIKLRQNRRELAFDKQFFDYIGGVNFLESRETKEADVSGKTKKRGVL